MYVRTISLITFLLFPMGGWGWPDMYRQQRFPGIFESASTSSTDTSPYWEYILREFVFKTISPPPPANNALYKRLLEAPFFGGPFQPITNDETRLLSKGDVFHLANGRWILCQEGCIACDVCSEQKSPTVKWILRRIKRQTSYDTPRYDLQLTIASQMDESFHSRNLWPRSYVYVTSHTDPTNLPDELVQLNKEYSFTTTDQYAAMEEPATRLNRFYKNTSPRQLVQEERNEEENDVFTPRFTFQMLGENARVKPPLQEIENKDRSRFYEQVFTESSIDKLRRDYELFAHRQQKNDGYVKRFTPCTKPMGHPAPLMLFYPPHDMSNNTNKASMNPIPVTPRSLKDSHLILGVDQFGQKHLIHIVPAASDVLNVTNKPSDARDMIAFYPAPLSLETHSLKSSKTAEAYEVRPTYQRIFRRVLDSLKNHRNSIENFLSPKVENDLTNNYRNSMLQTYLSMTPKAEETTTMEVEVYPASEPPSITFTADDEQSTQSNDHRNQVYYEPDGESDKDLEEETTSSNDVAEEPVMASFTYNTPLSYYNQQSSPSREIRYRRYPQTVDRTKQMVRPQGVALLSSNNMDEKMTGSFSELQNVTTKYGDAGKRISAREPYIRDDSKKVFLVNTTTEEQFTRTSTESFDVDTEEARQFTRHFEKLDLIFSKHDPQSLSNATKLLNTSESLILKELARSVVSHANTVEGFSFDNATSPVNLSTPPSNEF